ncbi:TRM11 family SAM-dependent methyltransferase [Niallia sp. 01092]|uniref:TRM11 family SAM-dependent methyltransferase n=1 Tax=unclassified Niallia TaxID=2837522 RepID=UPI003FD21168
MIDHNERPLNYLYTYACHEDEISLCRLEMRSLFHVDSETLLIESPLRIDPSRSPFIKDRIDLLYKGKSVEEIICQVRDLHIKDTTFKVIFIENPDFRGEFPFEKRREMARMIGMEIKGTVNLVDPEHLFAVMPVKDGLVFGNYHKSESIWLKHQSKPQQYSTALSTRVARAVVNIAVPNPKGKKVIDPCCGIGTVLIEALSMGIDIVGSDRNPLVTGGARENIAFFGLEGEVRLMDIRDIETHYDVAIIDMPYNLCSVLPSETKLEMLQYARRFADKAVIITVEEIDFFIKEAGFIIKDRAVAKKGNFIRQVLVCE